MPIETPQGNLDIKNATLRTSNLETQNIKIGSIFVGTGNSLEETANVGNSMSNTIQFTNTHTAFTTTGNVEVGGDLTVTGNVSDLNVVSNVNMLHTSNTAALKVNSNVVTEFPRSKKLIKYPRVALTGYSQDGYVVSSTTNYYDSGNPLYPWQVFNDSGYRYQSIRSDYSTSNGNYTGTVNQTTVNGSLIGGEWVQLQLPDKISLNRFTVALNLSTHGGRMGKSYTLAGSNDGSSWTTVSTHTQSYGNGSDGKDVNHDVNSTTMYKYYRLIATATFAAEGPHGGSWALGKWKLFGTPEYDPDANGVDVKVTSYPNVPNTDWLEVYYDAKDLVDGAVSTTSGAITGLGGTTNNGTAFGDPQVSNGAFVFDGTGDYITNTRSGYSSSGTYTVSTWVNIGKEASGQTSPNIFQYGRGQTSTTDTGIGLITSSSDDRITAFVYGNNDFTVYGIKKYGTWIHLTSVYELSASGTILTLYVNGNNEGSQATSTGAGIGATPHLSIGVQANVSDLPINATYFNGSIANFRLFNRALTPGEIWQLYAYQKEYFGHGDLGMTLKAGRLGIGTSEPRAMLDVRGDLYAPGTIVQVEQSLKIDTFSTTGASNHPVSPGNDVPGLAVTIHPKFANSKILVSYTVSTGAYGRAYLRIQRKQGGSTTTIAPSVGPEANTQNQGKCTTSHSGSGDSSVDSQSFEYYDTIGGTEPITYQIQAWTYHSVYYIYVNRGHDDGNGSNNGTYWARTLSSITAKEVCQ
jgi:hypothetical protein